MGAIEVRNNSNVIILDDNFGNMAVVESGVHPTNPAPFNAANSILATRRVTMDAASFPWWRFSVPTTSTATIGAQAFDATGKMTFCASLKSARAVGVLALGAIGSPPRTATYAAGRTYATVTSLIVFTDVQTRGAGLTQEYRIVRRAPYVTVAGTTVTAGWTEELLQDWQPVPPQGAASFPAPAYDPIVLVLDVTGY